MVGLAVIDDDPFVLEGISAIDWGAHGIELRTTASSAEEGLAAIRRTRPGILITDIRLPEMDGMELARRTREEYPATRIIVVTGHQDFEYARTAVRLGVTEFLLKPTTPAEVVRAVLQAKGTVEREERERKEKARLEREFRRTRQVLRRKTLRRIAAEEKGNPVSAGIDGPMRNHAVRRALQYIGEHYGEQIGLSSAARVCCLHPAYLSRLMRRETGETFSQSLLKVRLENACRLLRESDARVYEIAERVGFKEPRYFSAVFRNRHSLSPQEYRNRCWAPSPRSKSP